ncbi:DUF3820 family protein [Puia sp.]|jgi:hypothetical protein|uniref:DUF3820 family protein n=1 Tax=Puia sp. TaxID=2045100 RepID=UPI002F408798
MEEQSLQPDSEMLMTLVTMKMPFGKYKDTLLCNLPVSYLEWFHREGWPKGKLGMLLATIYEIRINGLEKLLEPLKRSAGGF